MGKQKAGKPKRKRVDKIMKIAGGKWEELARDMIKWDKMEKK